MGCKKKEEEDESENKCDGKLILNKYKKKEGK